MNSQPRFKRVLIKLSGEALMGDGEYGIEPTGIDQVAREVGLWLFGGVEADGDHACRFELYIGDAALNLDNAEVSAAFAAIVADPD